MSMQENIKVLIDMRQERDNRGVRGPRPLAKVKTTFTM